MRKLRGLKESCRLTSEQKNEVKEMFYNGYNMTEISKHFNKHFTTIYRLIGKKDQRMQINYNKKAFDIGYIYELKCNLMKCLENIEKIMDFVDEKRD
jgi:IS30 family transposase